MSENLKQILATFGPIKRKNGRPTKRTPQLDDRICKLLAEGTSWREIARIIGVNPDSLHEWRKNAVFFAITENAKNRWRKRELLNSVPHPRLG